MSQTTAEGWDGTESEMSIRAGISYNYTIFDILSQLSSALSIVSQWELNSSKGEGELALYRTPCQVQRVTFLKSARPASVIPRQYDKFKD
jgi:hypothetical protein